jgi:hypothetical protein
MSTEFFAEQIDETVAMAEAQASELCGGMDANEDFEPFEDDGWEFPSDIGDGDDDIMAM